MLNLEWLKAFVVFAEHENFTHAARALHISQPALHAQIGKLTEALGVSLYRRKGRRIELTEHGIQTLRFGREIIERTAAFERDLHGGDDTQPVILAAGEGAFLYLLGDAIEAYQRADEPPLRLITANRSQALDALRRGGCHLAVAALDVLPDDLAHTLLISVPLVLVVPDSHALATRTDVSVTDFAGLRLIVPPPEREHRRAVEVALRAADVPWHVAVEASGWELMLHFARLGLGVTVVNGCCRIPPGFTAVRVRDLPPKQYYVLHRPGPLPGAASALKRQILGSTR